MSIPAHVLVKIPKTDRAKPLRQTQAPWRDKWIDLANCDPYSTPTLTMASLGLHGRWGNQILQYIFLKTFAKLHHFTTETNDSWIGRNVFNLYEKGLSSHPRTALLCGCSKIHEQGNWQEFPFDLACQAAGHLYERSFSNVFLLCDPAVSDLKEYNWPFHSAELEGLFIVHTANFSRHKEFIQTSLPLKLEIRERLESLLDFWRSRRTLVVLHARRGDYETVFLQQGFEIVTPASEFLDWLGDVWHKLDDPLLILCSDNPERIKPALQKYHPIQSSDLGLYEAVRDVWPRLAQEEFLPIFMDWILMTQCDVLAISNSTFSFSAALFNTNARIFVRPVFDKRQLVGFDPWNSEPLLFLPREGLTTIPKLMIARSSMTLRGLGLGSLPHLVKEVVKRSLKYFLACLYLCWKLEGARAFLNELMCGHLYSLRIGRIYGQTIARCRSK